MATSVDNYAPDLLVEIQGAPLVPGPNFDVISVNVTDTIDRADSFTLVLRGHSLQEGRFASGGHLCWIDDARFEEMNEVRIEMGYVRKRTFHFLGEITKLAVSFPESGAPTFTVSGNSLQNRLQRYYVDKPFTNLTDSEIAEQVARMVNLIPQADKTEIRYSLISPNNAHLDAFLKSRAERIGYEAVVKEKILYFRKPGYLKTSPSTLKLEWGRNLINFNFSLSIYGMVTETTVQGSNTARGGDKSALIGKAKAGSESAKMGDVSGPELAQCKFYAHNPTNKPNRYLVKDHDVTTQQEATVLAQAQLDAKALDYITGSGSCIGNPDLVAGTVVQVTGIGQRFSGPYYVTSTTHTMDANGYRTSFEVKRNARNVVS